MIHRPEMKEITFEEALAELKGIVQTLEQGEIPLEKALALFEKGISLVGICSRKLDEVEKRVEILMRDHEGVLATRAWEKSEEESER